METSDLIKIDISITEKALKEHKQEDTAHSHWYVECLKELLLNKYREYYRLDRTKCYMAIAKDFLEVEDGRGTEESTDREQ